MTREDKLTALEWLQDAAEDHTPCGQQCGDAMELAFELLAQLQEEAHASRKIH